MQSKTIIEPIITFSDKIAECDSSINRLKNELTAVPDWAQEWRSIAINNAMKLKHMYLEILEKEGDLDFNKWKLGIKEPIIKQTIFEDEPAI